MYLKSERELYRRRRHLPILRILILALLLTLIGYIAYSALTLTDSAIVPVNTPTPIPTPTRAALSYLAEAEERYWDGDLNGAISAYAQALDLEPNQAEAYIELSRILTFQGYPERGLTMIREALRRQPDNGRAWALLGMAYDWLGLPQQAISAIEKAIELDPTLPEAYAYLAEAYIDKGDWFSANAMIATAVELDPANVDVLRNRGYVLENQGNYYGAIDVYREALEIHNGLAHIYLSIGRNASALGNLGVAQEAYEDAIEADPGNAAAWDRLGWAYVLIGEYDKAELALGKAMEIDPTLYEAYGHLATLYFQRRNYEGAIEMFKPALRYGEARSRRRTVFFTITEESRDAVGTTPVGREIARAELLHPQQFETPLRGTIEGQGEDIYLTGHIRFDVMNGRYEVELNGVPPAPSEKVYVGWFISLLTPERNFVRTQDIFPTPDGRVVFSGETGTVKGPPIEYYYTLALCHYLLDECNLAKPYIETALRISPEDANALQTLRLCEQ